MDKIFDIVNGLLIAAVSSGKLQETQILLFILIVAPLALVVWKIRGVVAFINEVRNSKLNELQHMLDGHELPDEVNACIKNEIKRIIGYRMTGIADVAKQQIIWQLLERNSHLVSADFFKKFRSFLLIKDKVLVFKKGGLTGLKTACMVGSRANFCCPLFYSWYYQFTDMNRFLLGDI